MPQKFVSLQSIENIEAQMQNDVRNSRAGNSNKIGFFHLNQTNDEASSSEDEYSGGGFQSDSSSDSTTSESDDGIVFPSTGITRMFDLLAYELIICLISQPKNEVNKDKTRLGRPWSKAAIWREEGVQCP